MENERIICIQSTAFYSLLEEVIEWAGEQHKLSKEDPWIDTEEAMRLLRIKSKSTLQKLRDEGKIRFSQPEKKIILYDRASLLSYLESHVKEPF